MKRISAVPLCVMLLALCACGQPGPKPEGPAAATTRAGAGREAAGYIHPEEGYQIVACTDAKGAAFDYTVCELSNGEPYGGRYFDAVVLKDGRPVSVLHPREWGAMPDDAFTQVVERDVDFDGKLDVLLFTGGYGSQMAARYDCWLQRGGKLVHCPSFYEIMNPAVDDGAKEILGSSRGSAASYYYTKYRFVGGEFIPEEQLVREISGWRTEEYVNGEWVVRETHGENDPWDTGRWRALQID